MRSLLAYDPTFEANYKTSSFNRLRCIIDQSVELEKALPSPPWSIFGLRPLLAVTNGLRLETESQRDRHVLVPSAPSDLINLKLDSTCSTPQKVINTVRTYRRYSTMAAISQKELDDIYTFAVELGKQAGDMLMAAAQVRIDGGNASAEQPEHVEKENAVDLVTETDESMFAMTQLSIQAHFHFLNVRDPIGRGFTCSLLRPTSTSRLGTLSLTLSRCRSIHQTSDYREVSASQVRRIRFAS
ncbi:MAG: hypothetical protein EOO38_11580 [Cytophagaceae bacterium]|nr:MAG: hypothetical protein EOO38_11580 [Cytophagaceae bacterium]